MSPDSPLKILAIFTKLGLTSFGGPAAHLGFFREEFVARRKWLTEEKYADLIALCQFLPGPASSQVGLALGMLRGGKIGAAMAWIGFTIPSAIALILAATILTRIPESVSSGAIHGLKLVAVAVVANAVWGMAKKLCDTRTKATIAIAVVIVMILAATTWAQIGCIVAAAIAGRLLFTPRHTPPEKAPADQTPADQTSADQTTAGRASASHTLTESPQDTPPAESALATATATTQPTKTSVTQRQTRATAQPEPSQPEPLEPTPRNTTHNRPPTQTITLTTLFLGLLIALPVTAALTHSHELDMIDAYYRAGALVFGGGHVVLPLLETTTVTTGWLTNEQFLAGYGITQAVPGPLFTVATYLGYVDQHTHTPLLGAAIALLAIFLPSFLLVPAAIPIWETLRTKPTLKAALTGVNAAVVGLLLAALHNPVWTSAVKTGTDVAAIAAAWLALVTWKLPPWLVVLTGGLIGALIWR